MHNVSSDLKRNILFIEMQGFMSDEEVEKVADSVIEKAKGLQPGFAVINDISTFKPASKMGSKHIARAQAFLVESKVGKVIRITDNPISKMQLNRTSKTVEGGYTAIEVRTMDEALSQIS